jgi:hypothetical protein
LTLFLEFVGFRISPVNHSVALAAYLCALAAMESVGESQGAHPATCFPLASFERNVPFGLEGGFASAIDWIAAERIADKAGGAL